MAYIKHTVEEGQKHWLSTCVEATQRMYMVSTLLTGIALVYLTIIAVVVPCIYGTSAAEPSSGSTWLSFSLTVGGNVFTTSFCSVTLIITALMLEVDLSFMSKTHLGIFVFMRTAVIFLTRQRIADASSATPQIMSIGVLDVSFRFALYSVMLEVLAAVGVFLFIRYHVAITNEVEEDEIVEEEGDLKHLIEFVDCGDNMA
eukprot:GILI01003321.1.p1 GENE.GILI01003321.1~~GILI01003321.1.p1  ORF type:complete len:216 (-),score=34.41 GILI01003321.1:190-792(-)